MAKRGRKPRSSSFKAKVALAAVKEHKTLNELAKEFEIHTTMISKWRSTLVSRAHELFDDGRKAPSEVESDGADKEYLYQQIGQLKVELDWLKKKSGTVS